MTYAQMPQHLLTEELAVLRKQYSHYKNKNLTLDMSRGKPGADQLVQTQEMLGVISSPDDCITENGFDCRNYGLLDGIPEAKRIFSDLLDVPAKNIIVGGNSSLNLMYDEITRAMLYGTCDSDKPWSRYDEVKFICPVPGYDRHFAICETMGIKMINVPMTAAGPDMDVIEALAAQDDSIKGIWCVPKYSNPDGIVYSDETIRRFASLKPKARDFRIFWDNAYIVHGFADEPVQQLNLFTEAPKYGNSNLPLIFTSTSKISFPGSGLAVLAASDANIAQTKKILSIMTIGYDKLNQMRHVKYFGTAARIKEHMKRHAGIIRPKFELVLNEFEKLRPLGIAEWNRPEGGYFISLDVLDGCAGLVYTLAKEAGVTLTPAGATFPYGIDPRDRNLRIAPTYPSNADLQTAVEVLCLCVKIVSVEKIIGMSGISADSVL
ncbi:MAG: aminotransferase class I/II-fold pyridoxal phosphate-dependent enzyme [Eubacteriales bacterium]